MSSELTEMINRTYDNENVLEVRNRNSEFCEFYELRSPYLFVLEHGEAGKKFDYVLMGPNYVESDVFPEDASERGEHQHDYVEIMWVLKGECRQKIEEQERLYHAGQCCVLSPRVHHVELMEEGTELFFVGLSEESLSFLLMNDRSFNKEGRSKRKQGLLYHWFGEILHQGGTDMKDYWDFYPLVPEEIIVPELENLFGRMIVENRRLEPGAYLMIHALIAKALSLIQDSSLYSAHKMKTESHKNEQLFLKIQQVLEEQKGRVHRAELENRLHFNAHYMNRVVKMFTGMSVIEYGRVFRMKEAARLLIQTNDSISAVMERLGETNRTAFYKAFKTQYGMMPNEYRENAKTAFEKKDSLSDMF